MTDQVAANPFGFDNEDLNGECFILGADGEAEVFENTNIVYFPHGIPTASDATAGEPLTWTNSDINLFVYVNAVRLKAAERDAVISARVAYARALAGKAGLISPDFTTASHNVRYNHAVRLSEAQTVEARTALDAASDDRTAFVNALAADVRTKLRKYFSDMVCCVAYIFRVRGHHYRDDFQDRYTTLWSRCLHRETDLVLKWVNIATDAFHAIMPDVLDNYWLRCTETAKCAGTLIKRYDSAPAGCAGVVALKRGLDDITMLFPGVVNHVPAAHVAFNDMYEKVQANRWAGSVNCRFYGAHRVRINEGEIGALASVVMGIYDHLAPDSKLRESPALKRLAETAPATGGAIGLAARRATQDERLSLINSMANSGE